MCRKSYLKLSVIAIMLIVSMVVLGQVNAPKTYPIENFSKDIAYQVRNIIDGDTVKINYKGKLTTIRLIGVDTPETGKSFGKEAAYFLNNLLLGESVYLRFDVQKTDKYGRTLAYLYRAPDGLFVNLEIVRQGYGKFNTVFPFKHKSLFQYYGGQAQKDGKGLWNASNSISQQTSIQTDPRTKTVYITQTGRKYHRSSCQYLKRSKIPISLESAKQNYAPCSVCRP